MPRQIAFIVVLVVCTQAAAGEQPEETTFYVTSDTHLGAVSTDGTPSIVQNLHTVACLHNTPGLEWPPELGGGVIRPPDGVVITGDLVDAGLDPRRCADQWAQYEAVYGPPGGRGVLRFPVFEGFGNHDGGHSLLPLPHECNLARRALRLRRASQAGPRTYSGVSANGLHYSWDWGPLHVVHLNLYPGDLHDPNCSYPYEAGTWPQPEYSLSFLARDLDAAVGRSGRPVMVAHHYGMDAWWGALWWSDAERDAYYQVLKPYNVVALLVGHTHATDFYAWQGINVFNAPAAQQADERGAPLPCSFLVFHFDWRTGTMRVAERSGRDGWGRLAGVYNITTKAAPSLSVQRISPHSVMVI